MRSSPRFEVVTTNDKYQWLASSGFLGDLKPPQRPSQAESDIYQVLQYLGQASSNILLKSPHLSLNIINISS